MNDSLTVGALLDLAVESWRFSRNFEHVLEKLDAGDKSRHLSQFKWFIQRIAGALEAVGMRLVDVSGQSYTPGIAATPINLDEFEPDDELVISYMLEPVIMGKDGVVRMGKVVLHKAENK